VKEVDELKSSSSSSSPGYMFFFFRSRIRWYVRVQYFFPILENHYCILFWGLLNVHGDRVT
jgi:hypothetical protein